MRRVGAVDLAQLAVNPAVPDAGHTRLFSKPDGRSYLRTPGGGVTLSGSSTPELEPVRAATTINLASLSGLPTVDGVALAAGDRVLVRYQGTPSQNGVYIAATGAWQRASDADTVAKLQRGTSVTVLNGDNFRYKTLTQIVNLTTLGTDTLDWRMLTFVDANNLFLFPAPQGVGHLYWNFDGKALTGWDGGRWVDLNGSYIATSTTRPPFPAPGNMLYETDTGFTYIWDGSAWKLVGGGAGGGGSSPVGTVTLWPTNTAPAGGYLICNGGTFSSTTWPELAAVLGDTYGTHSGTTYYLPDFRGRSPIGVGSTVPAAGTNNYALALKWGSEYLQTHAHSGTTSGQSADHHHSFNMTVNGYPGGIAGQGAPAVPESISHYYYNSTTGASGDHSHTFSTGNHDRNTAEMGNVHPVLAMNYIIKASGGGTGSSGSTVYTALVPALVAGTWTNVVHSLGTESVGAWVKETVTKENVGVDWKVIDSNTIAVRSHSAVAANFLTAVVKA